MKVYIATGLANARQHNRLRDELQRLGVGLTYDWTTHGAVFERGRGGMRQVAYDESQGVLAADLVVVLLPGGRGTHAEMGMAIAGGKQVVLCGAGSDALDGPEACAFYHHPLVRISQAPTVNMLAYDIQGLLLGVGPLAEEG